MAISVKPKCFNKHTAMPRKDLNIISEIRRDYTPDTLFEGEDIVRHPRKPGKTESIISQTRFDSWLRNMVCYNIEDVDPEGWNWGV